MRTRCISGFIIVIILFYLRPGNVYIPHDVYNYSISYSDAPCRTEVFSFKMISPNDSLIVNNIAALEQDELPKGCMGIDVHLSLSKSSYASRSINYNVSDIPTKRVPLFDDGGYDLTFYQDKIIDNSSELIQYYHSQQTVDIGKNWYNYQNSTLDGLLEQYLSENNDTIKKQVAYRIQHILYEEVPSIVIATSNNLYYEVVINNLHPVFGTGIATPLGQQNSSRAHEAARDVRQAIAHLIPYNTNISEIFGGNARIIPTRWLPNWEYFDNSLQPYNYSIATAKKLLAKAGFDYTYDIVPPLKESTGPTLKEIFFTFGVPIIAFIVIVQCIFVRPIKSWQKET